MLDWDSPGSVGSAPKAAARDVPPARRPAIPPHRTYIRRPADLPSAERSVQLQLRVRRFSCPNTKCTRRTFAERLPGLLAPRARRTSRSSNSRSARCTAAPASTCCAVACCSPLDPTPHIKCGSATKSGQPQVQASGAKRSSCKVRPESEGPEIGGESPQRSGPLSLLTAKASNLRPLAPEATGLTGPWVWPASSPSAPAPRGCPHEW